MAQPPSIDWSALRISLQSADRLSRQLLDLLQQERQSLERRDYGSFEQLLGDKGQLLLALQRNTAERQTWLMQHGFNDDRAALQRLERDAPELAQAWQQLAALWRDCQHASRVNEQISQRTRAAVSRLLDVLSGNAGQGSTYDGKGTTQRMQSGRPITSA